MAVKLGEFMAGRAGRMVAGRLYSERQKSGKWFNYFYYVETDVDAAVPAAVLIDNWMDANRYGGKGWGRDYLLNTIASFGWLNTYMARFVELGPHHEERNWLVDAIKVDHAALRETFSVARLGPPPKLTGLYTQEIKLDDEYVGEATPKEVESGKRKEGKRFVFATGGDMHPYLRQYVAEVNRARRYYLLAAYCLLSKTKEFTHRGIDVNNLVGSILIDDAGEVLAWGVNTGAYRHAEVNTLLNYFKRTGKKKLPPKSTLFSTLKPCAMCSAFIRNALPDSEPTRVWYGQFDPGRSGSTPLLGELSKSFHGTASNKAVRVGKPGGAGKVGISSELEKEFDKVYGQQAAAWTKSSGEAKALFAEAYDALEHKAGKKRDDGPKAKVLAHLKPWLDAGFA